MRPTVKENKANAAQCRRNQPDGCRGVRGREGKSTKESKAPGQKCRVKAECGSGQLKRNETSREDRGWLGDVDWARDKIAGSRIAVLGLRLR